MEGTAALTEDMSPARAAGTYRRSASTVHDQRLVFRQSLARSSGTVLVRVVGLVWLGACALLEDCGYVVPRIREFGC